jgi:hypothetical protein
MLSDYLIINVDSGNTAEISSILGKSNTLQSNLYRPFVLEGQMNLLIPFLASRSD